MKIGIIGHGFVGRAIEHGFTNYKNSFCIVDTRYKEPDERPNIIGVGNDQPAPVFTHEIQELRDWGPAVIFVAVPTPVVNGKFDSSIIDDVMHQLTVYCKIGQKVVIKSTVLPNFLRAYEINSAGVLRLVYNPEFLTERNAFKDFIYPPMHVFGSSDKDAIEEIKYLYSAFSNCVAGTPMYSMDITAASLIKYTMNSFLATKVVFFNYIRDIINDSGTSMSYGEFIDVLSTDKRIGSSHMNVPGPDGHFGFGGHCFPKDTKALSEYAEGLGVPHDLLDTAIELNDKMRDLVVHP